MHRRSINFLGGVIWVHHLSNCIFLNFKYSKGDPNCKDFIKLKNNKKNNTTVQRGSGGQEEPGGYN
jgi:hypothetical protein